MSRFVRIHVGVGQRCRASARDKESSTLQAKKWSVTFHRPDVERYALHFLGSQGGGVFVASNAVANFEGCDIHDNAADHVCLPSALALNFHRGDRTLQSVRFAGKLTPCHNAHSKGQHSSGAMEDMSGKVQNANTHSLRRQSHEHTHSSRSVQGLVQWGDG